MAEVASRNITKAIIPVKLTPTLTTLALGASLLALTACSGSEEPAASPTPAAEVTSAAPEPSPTETMESAAPEETEESTASGDVTAPGTELATSEDFTVPLAQMIYDSETEETVYSEAQATYSFDGIREGSADDLSGVFGDDDLAVLEGNSLYYVDYTVTLVDGALADAASSIADVTGFDPVDTAGGGNLGNFVFFDGGPDVCAYPDSRALAETGSAPSCEIMMVAAGESIESLLFSGETVDSISSPYAESPIVWTVG